MESVLTIFAIAAVIDTAIILFLLQRVKRLKLLKSIDALSAKATLNRKLTSSSNGKSVDSLSIVYEFKDYKGTSVAGKHAVSSAMFEAISEGDTIPITYHRQSPRINAHSDCVDELISKGRIVSSLIIIGSLMFTIMLCVMFYIAHGAS